MKHWLAVVALICFGSSAAQAKPYFDTILKDPAHPKLTLSTLFTSRAAFDGAETKAAIVYHKGDATDTLWPQKLLDLGAPPLSWALFELGVGGNSQSAFVRGGASVDVAQTILGPAAQLLRGAGGTAAVIGNLLISPDGNGVNLSIGWKARLIENGMPLRINDIRLPPRYGVGYTYQF